ncbi:hypothetical protein ACTG16_23515 [Aeromonas sp. 23P]|uniref:hypothetical protein n=1 Tax=Aeromonas sp. 23P TaxID=3452716 RepID=UPI003F7A6ADD
MSKGYRLNTMALMAAINKEINNQIPNLTANARLMNCVIQAANEITAEFAKDSVMATDGMGLAAWLESDDTGLSSKYMACVLSGQFCSEYAYPRDPDDFGRCVRLLKAVPELAPKLIQMQGRGAMWDAVVENWDRWVAMLNEKQHEELYREMRQYRS